MSSGTGRMGDGRSDVRLRRTNGTLFKDSGIIDIFFGAYGNTDHGFKSFHWKFSCGCFSRKHNCARSIINSIGDISCLCACGTRMADHRIQHLGSGDHCFSLLHCFFDELFLQNRNLFQRDFYAEITARNHDSVRDAQNFVNISNPIHIFNFCNNTHIMAVILF